MNLVLLSEYKSDQNMACKTDDNMSVWPKSYEVELLKPRLTHAEIVT